MVKDVEGKPVVGGGHHCLALLRRVAAELGTRKLRWFATCSNFPLPWKSISLHYHVVTVWIHSLESIQVKPS